MAESDRPPSSAEMLPQPPTDQQADTKMAEVSVSSAGLFLSRITFQYLVIFACSRLFIYIFKIFEDGMSVRQYYESNDINFALISAACLAIPPLFYAIYLMGEHMTRSPTIDGSEVGTKLINGLLLFPWQIKRHLDVLHFAAQRVCQWRRPNEEEKSNFQSMKRIAETLEFFEDIYAGFLQILLQTYLVILAVITASDKEGGSTTHGSKVRPSVYISSLLCIFSMLIAVRRRDDGPMTCFFSFVGWSSIFISRVLSFSLAAVVLHSWISLFATLHVLGVTWWVYTIAIESHKVAESGPPHSPERVSSPIHPSAPPAGGDFTSRGEHSATGIKRKPCFTALLVFLFFGIPSLLIWPMMFQLRQKKRPYIFLALIAAENTILLAIWFFATAQPQALSFPLNLALTALVTTGTGVFMLLLYACCKPSMTDQVVLHNIREQRTAVSNSSTPVGQSVWSVNATKYGIYYEFCDIVFRLPATHEIAATLRDIQPIMDAAFAK